MATPVTAPGLQAADQEWTNEQAAAAGLGWVPKNHHLYGTAGYVGSTPPPGQPPATNGTAPANQPYAPPAGGQTVPGQAGAAQTYSATPGAAPTAQTTNQGTQDVARNSYLQRATQPTTVDPNDPVIRQQSDAFAAAEERARRDQSADLAEATAGTGQTGFQQGEQRLINERSAQRRGAFEADLVRQELTNKRQEIATALESLAGMISADQTRALQERLAALDAQLKTAALSSSNALGGRELDLKDKLGTMGGNIDLLRLLTQNTQFNKELGFNIGDREQYWNQVALDRVLG